MPDGRTRAFFALWPDAAVAQALHDAGRIAHASCGGRIMRRDTLHLTLAFLGDIDAGQLDAATAAATKVGAGDTGRPSGRRWPAEATPISLALDSLACWQHNHIVWAGCSAPPAALSALAGRLAEQLREHGLQLDRREFVSHVTLLRDARCGGALPALPPINWTSHEFMLMASEPAAQGRHYRILRRWPLG